jgi:CheY-like chemotaxis protein
LVEVEVSEETGKGEFLPTGDECILFIDDEQKLVNLGKQILGRLGYSVITRTSSLEALELFRKNPAQFDLVITDLTMPAMTGDRLGMELIKLRPDIPIILCSGSIEHTLKGKTKDLGVKAILMKPVEMKNLANTVRKVLDEKRGR